MGPRSAGGYSVGTSILLVNAPSGSQWNWVLIDGVAALRAPRLGTDPIDIDEDGFEIWEYLAQTAVEEVNDFPIVRRIEDEDAWMRMAFPSPPEAFSDGVLQRFVTERDSLVSYVIPPTSGAPMCHVFEPVTWSRPDNSGDWLTGTGARFIQVNPVDVILSVITSTGSPGSNGSHDTAPGEFGLGIALSDVDTASFTVIGDRLDTQGISAGTVAILLEDVENLSDWLGDFAKVYGLAIATTIDGSIRLIDLTVLDFDTTVTLDEGDLVAGPAKLSIDAQMAIESVSIKYDRPWVNPMDQGSTVDDTFQAKPSGILALFERVRGESLELEPDFAAGVDDSSQSALHGRILSLMGYSQGVMGTLSADVDPGYSGDIGDTVSVTLPAFPNAKDTGAMSGALCRIVDRVHESRPVGEQPRDTLTMVVYGVTSADRPRKWAPAGVVASVTSATVFDLEASAYHGADYASDAASFADGVKVDIWSANWALRSTTSAGTLSGTSGNQVTLSAAAQNGSGDVTPVVGDKLTLSAESDQSASDAAGWAWMSASTPGLLWH